MYTKKIFVLRIPVAKKFRKFSRNRLTNPLPRLNLKP